VGSPGGGQVGQKKGHDSEAAMRRALADRIEDNLGRLLHQVAQILQQNRGHVLCMAHALETHKTLSGEDVVAVFEHGQGPLVDGRPYADPGFVQKLEEYHASAVRAHQDHSKVLMSMPAAPKPIWDSLGVAATPITPATPKPDQLGS
jgi:hypothetical protein